MLHPDGSLWLLGRGSGGVTYKALDLVLRREVALKVVDAGALTDEAAREKFVGEARTAAALHHPNLAAIYYFGEENGVCFYAMEMVQGQSLESYIGAHGPLHPHHALDIAAQVAAALGTAHDMGVAHRDVKPSNIMVALDANENLAIKLIDFGLAAPVLGAGAGDAPERFTGTLLYASPEQLDGAACGAASDVYSLGAVLFFMLAGRPPFEGSTFSELAHRHTMQEVPVSTLAGVPVKVSSLVLRLMAKDPAERPAVGAEARAEIEQILRGYRVSAGLTAQEWMAGRFARVETAGLLEGGELYKVQVPGAEELAVFRFDNSARGLMGADRMRLAVPMVRAIKSSAVRTVLDMADVADGLVVVCELMAGTRLLSVMRVRRTLPAAEALLVLRPVAEVLDEAAAAGMQLPHVGLRDVFLQPACGAGTPLGRWPYLRVAVDLLPLAEAKETDLNTTLVGRSVGGAGSVAYESSGHDAASMVAALAYEMLGGTSAPSARYYVPLPELSENANRTLRRVFEDGGGITASALVDRLLGNVAAPLERPVVTVGAASARPWSPAFPPPLPPNAAASVAAPRKRGKGVWVAAGVAVVLAAVAAAGAALYAARGWHGRQVASAPIPATPAPTPPPAVAVRAPEARPETTPEIKEDARAQGAASAGTGVAAAERAQETEDPFAATQEVPYENSLGMKFVPAGTEGVLFSIYETRVRDFAQFVRETQYPMNGGMYVLKAVRNSKGAASVAWEKDSNASWRNPGFRQTGDDPVVGVSSEDAQAFCEWLTRRERVAGRIGAVQEYRLPTDAEWSAAVGSAEFPWGNSWPPPRGVGNYFDTSGAEELPGSGLPSVPESDGYGYTSPVGRFAPNRYGLYDMGGNVWEWCATWYTANLNDAATKREVPALNQDLVGRARVVRGGSWYNRVRVEMRSAFRTIELPLNRSVFSGFRVVFSEPNKTVRKDPEVAVRLAHEAEQAKVENDQKNFVDAASDVEGPRPIGPRSSKILSFESALAQADAGDGYAQAVVSIYYGLGLGCDADAESSKKYVMLSAKQRNALGLFRLAEMREAGEAMEQNSEQAAQLMQKAKVGLQKLPDDPYAMTALAAIYARETPSSPKIRELLTKASEMGYEPARAKLSQLDTNQ